MTLDEFSYVALAVFGAAFITAGAGYGIRVLWRTVVNWQQQKRDAERHRIDAERDREVTDLRSQIDELELQLSGDALEARKALIRESFAASGKSPNA